MADSVGKSARLAPGFRFHPTDEELVRYYLWRKVCGRPLRFDAISQIDIYKSEPWDLPAMSRLKTRDLEWYFFSMLDKKYGNGSKTNRATEKGYWKTTGKDRAVYHKSRIVGMKKTLVYHNGRAPKGERSNWVMHEYRLVDEELYKARIVQDAFVLCRVFQKSGCGPKNGEKYGAPFVEEEWEGDELETLPKEEALDDVMISDHGCLDEADIEQILGVNLSSEDVPLPLDYNHGDSGSYVEESTDVVDDDDQKPLVGDDEIYCGSQQLVDYGLFNMPVQNYMQMNPVKNEYICEPSHSGNDLDANYLLDEPFLDATDNLQFDDGAFLEANDLSNPVEADALDLDLVEQYLTYFEDNKETEDFMALDSSKLMESDNALPEELSLDPMNMNAGNDQVGTSNQHIVGRESDIASSSVQESSKHTPGLPSPYAVQASRMLSSIPAPPAFASEFPTKNVARLMKSASESSSPIHVTAGVIQITNINLSDSGMEWPFGKQSGVNVVLSFDLSRGFQSFTNVETMFSIQSGKTGSAMARGWFYFLLFWALALSMTFKIGNCICAR